MVEFSFLELRVFMMTINNKSERNDQASASVGLLLATALVMEFRIILCRKETNSFVFSSAGKLKIYLIAMILLSHITIKLPG